MRIEVTKHKISDLLQAGKLIMQNTRDKSLKVVQHKTAIIIVTIKEERVCKAKCSLKEDYTTSCERKYPLFISLHFSNMTDVKAVIITHPIIVFFLINRYKNIVLNPFRKPLALCHMYIPIPSFITLKAVHLTEGVNARSLVASQILQLIQYVNTAP